MLVIFDLDWERFDINDQVVAANDELNGLARRLGADFFISFNLASRGAGERILAPRARNKPGGDVLDKLRENHWRVARSLGENENFKACQDVAEMLAGMKKRDFHLAAVFSKMPGTEGVVALERARLLDYFEDSVYGAGSQDRAVHWRAMSEEGASPSDVIVIADDPGTVNGIQKIRPRATIGYLDPYRPDESARIKALEGAGANYVTAGGTSIPWYCDYMVRGQSLRRQDPQPRR